jgi:hypothetical protein
LIVSNSTGVRIRNETDLPGHYPTDPARSQLALARTEKPAGSKLKQQQIAATAAR